MIQQIETFLNYFESIRRRTIRFIQAVPPDQIDWVPQAGEFTCGDIIRHLAAAEQMYVGVVVTDQWNYPGHERSAHPTLEDALAYLHASHADTLTQLRTAGDAVLTQRRAMLYGPPVSAWRLLMAMVEHEVHHRSQLATYLTLMGLVVPHLYGLGVEDLPTYTIEQTEVQPL